MRSRLGGGIRDGRGRNAPEVFNVLLVYEDQASAERGMALYQRLVAKQGNDRLFHLNVWKFAVLGFASLAEISDAQAADADLVIVCTRGEAEPPEQVRAWFQRWVDQKRDNHCVLVVLSGPPEDRPDQLGVETSFIAWPTGASEPSLHPFTPEIPYSHPLVGLGAQAEPMRL